MTTNQKIKKTLLNSFIVFILFLAFNKYIYSQAILGGDGADITDIPYIVSLENSGVHVCGGVIIDRNWILTAGHCVYWPISEFAGAPDMIHAGSTDQTNDSQGQRITVDYSVLHPNWNGDLRNGHDLALLKLSEPICFNDNVQPIAYSTNSNPIPEDESALFAG